MNRIMLTDWPKVKYIEVNYRGIETEKLVEWHKALLHTMMISGHEEGGGYVMHYNYKEVGEELDYRNARPKGY